LRGGPPPPPPPRPPPPPLAPAPAPRGRRGGGGGGGGGSQHPKEGRWSRLPAHKAVRCCVALRCAALMSKQAEMTSPGLGGGGDAPRRRCAPGSASRSGTGPCHPPWRRALPRCGCPAPPRRSGSRQSSWCSCPPAGAARAGTATQAVSERCTHKNPGSSCTDARRPTSCAASMPPINAFLPPPSPPPPPPFPALPTAHLCGGALLLLARAGVKLHHAVHLVGRRLCGQVALALLGDDVDQHGAHCRRQRPGGGGSRGE